MSFLPLSACPLWKHQREFFETLGVDAWLAGGVPHHITSNAFIADAYARIIHAYLRENQFDPAQPVNIVELGAGHGRLSYQLVRRLVERLDRFPIEGVRVRYVMTDLARRNIEYWRDHGWLQNYIEGGLLDMAEFDAGSDEDIRLEISGETLSAENCRNPLVAIANYVFDSIPQDSFRIEDGRLFETLIAVARPEDAPVERVLAGVKIEYRREAVAGARYANPLWNELLEGYRARLSPVADVLFPSATLQVIGNLERISHGRLLLLVADQGYDTDAAMQSGEMFLKLDDHGSFSMLLDFQLIGEYFRRRGGEAIRPEHSYRRLNVSAFVLGSAARETRIAYQDAIERFGPDDLSMLAEVLATCDSMTVEQIIAWLRLSEWDHHRLRKCLPALREMAPGMTADQRQQLALALHLAWERWFPVGDDDLAFDTGTLLMQMECYPEAMEFFRHSEGLGPSYETALNCALCHFAIGEMAEAREAAERALAMSPESEEAKTLIERCC